MEGRDNEDADGRRHNRSPINCVLVACGVLAVGILFGAVAADSVMRGSDPLEQAGAVIVLATAATVLGAGILLQRRASRTIQDIEAQLGRLSNDIDGALKTGEMCDSRSSSRLPAIEGVISRVMELQRRAVEREEALESRRRALETAVASREADLQAARAELSDAEARAGSGLRVKSEFLTRMSHEIRTPLNAVIGMTELVLDSHPTAEQSEYLETVKMSAESLLDLVNDILDYSKIETGRIVLCPAPFCLRDALSDVVRPLAFRAHQKGIELAFRCRPDVPDALIGDMIRLRQILVNLVGNAVKFTEHGEVVIEVAKESETDAEIGIRLSVRDTGIGIATDKLETIFQAFAQADHSSTRRYGGTGLGLAIASKLAGLMGGHLDVQSENGVGSCFSLTVRLGKQHTTSLVIPRIRDTSGLRVIVADDNHTSMRVLTELLSTWRAESTPCVSSSEVSSRMREAQTQGTPYDLLILDADMAGNSQRWLIDEMAGDTAFRTTGIILLTKPARTEAIELPRELEIAARVSKPIKPSELYDAIVNWLDRQHTGTQHDSKEPAATAPSRPHRILVAEDNPVNQRLVHLLLKKRGYDIVLVNDGQEAVDAAMRGEFDCVLMDIQMPNMCGLDATREIRRRESEVGREPLPIVALTANAMRGDRELCLEVGMNEYLTKPIRKNELFDTLDEILGRHPACRS